MMASDHTPNTGDTEVADSQITDDGDDCYHFSSAPEIQARNLAQSRVKIKPIVAKWSPSSAELEEMNAWNPTGHSGRTAQFVQYMKDMFNTPAHCKFFQDQVKDRLNNPHIFTTPQYLSTSWDKMVDGQRVKFLKWAVQPNANSFS